MNNPGTPEFRPNDEINLSEVYNRLLKVLGTLVAKMLTFIKFLVKRWILLFGFGILGMALGYGIYSLKRPFFTYSMTVLLSDIRNDIVGKQLENLSLMVNERNYSQVSQQLKVSERVAEQIKSVSFQNLDQYRVTEDSVLAAAPFIVEVNLFNNTIQDSVENGIVYYLESNSYLSKQKQIKKEHLESIITKLKKDIATIDSTKTLAVNPRGPANGFVYGEPLDPTNLYKESVSMFERQTSLEATLKRMEIFDVIVHFAPRRGPSGPDLKKYLILGGFLSFSLGLLISILIEWKQRKYGLFSSNPTG